MAGPFILLVFFFLLIALLIMPIHFRINEEENGYLTDKPAFLKLYIDLNGKSLLNFMLDICYIRFTWYPLQKYNRNPVNKKKPSGEEEFTLPDWNRLKFMLGIAWQAIKKSRLNKLYLDLDTSNVILNANLYPFFELMSDRPRINLNINYTGKFALCLDFENNLWNFVRAIIWNLIKRTFSITNNKLYGIQSR